MYYVVLAIFLAAFLLIYRVIHSPFGNVLKAIRENEPRAISLGYDAERYKLLAFVLSATLAGLAGATKAIVFQLASLTDVHWTMSGEVVLMTLLGGMGTIFGPVVGAFAIIGLENYLAGFGQWVTVITGAIFVVCVLAFRRGIVGETRRVVGEARGPERRDALDARADGCDASTRHALGAAMPVRHPAAIGGRSSDLVAPGVPRRRARTAPTSSGCRTGACAILGAFAKGRRTGTFLFWASTGARIAVIPYDDDAKVGTVALWYRAGHSAGRAAPQARGGATRPACATASPGRGTRTAGSERSIFTNAEASTAAQAWNEAGAPLAEPEARRRRGARCRDGCGILREPRADDRRERPRCD